MERTKGAFLLAKEAKVIQGSLPRYKKPSFWRVLAQNKTLLLMCLPAILYGLFGGLFRNFLQKK